MKKTALLLVFLSCSLISAAGIGPGAPAPVSGTAAITMNLSAAALSGSKNSIGISGLSFRMLDAGRKGCQIPLNLNFSSSDSSNSAGSSSSTSFSISSGYYFINPLFLSDFIRVNILSGFNAGYAGSWSDSSRNGSGPYLKRAAKYDSYTFSLGISGGMEVEVPIGRIFSLPGDTICLAGGLNVSATGNYRANYSGVRYNSGTLTFSLGTASYGTGIETLGIRYYF